MNRKGIRCLHDVSTLLNNQISESLAAFNDTLGF